jgi:hypothetical protein
MTRKPHFILTAAAMVIVTALMFSRTGTAAFRAAQKSTLVPTATPVD